MMGKFSLKILMKFYKDSLSRFAVFCASYENIAAQPRNFERVI